MIDSAKFIWGTANLFGNTVIRIVQNVQSLLIYEYLFPFLNAILVIKSLLLTNRMSQCLLLQIMKIKFWILGRDSGTNSLIQGRILKFQNLTPFILCNRTRQFIICTTKMSK